MSGAASPKPKPQGSSRKTIPDPALLKARLKELDREFARQTKQLTAMVKRLMNKKIL